MPWFRAVRSLFLVPSPSSSPIIFICISLVEIYNAKVEFWIYVYIGKIGDRHTLGHRLQDPYEAAAAPADAMLVLCQFHLLHNVSHSTPLMYLSTHSLSSSAFRLSLLNRFLSVSMASLTVPPKSLIRAFEGL